MCVKVNPAEHSIYSRVASLCQSDRAVSLPLQQLVPVFREQGRWCLVYVGWDRHLVG